MLPDRDRIAVAARLAGAEPVVAALPQGYDTMLSRIFFGGESTGVTLSGGQWQRLALARALMREQRDPLILDEPSAGLDAQAEHEIHQRLRQHPAGRASVAAGGVYAGLFEVQASGYREPASHAP